MTKRSRLPRGILKYALLYLLSEQERHGYDLIREFREHGWGSPSPGSIYPLLSILESDGMLTSREDDGRRVYEITESGKEALSVHASRVHDLVRKTPENVADVESNDQWDRLNLSARRLLHAVSQIDLASETATIVKVREVLDNARREIYAILAAE